MARGQPAGEEVYRPEVGAEDLPRKIVPEIRSLPLAEGVESFTQNVAAKFRADSASWAGDALAKTRTQAVQALDTAKSQVPAGEDPGNFTEKYLANFDKSTAGLAETAGHNPVATQMVQKGLSELRDTLATHTMEWEAAQRVAYRTDSVRTNIKSQSDVVEAHPELMQSVGSTLMDQINTIGGNPATRLALAREMHEQLSLAAANGISRQDPRGTLTALNDPEKAGADFKALTGLNDTQRETVRNRANEQLTRPVFSALEQDDTAGAHRYLEANRDIMDPKVAWELSRRIDAQVKEKQNEQKQDIADRYQDSLTAARFGLPNALAVTRAELNVLYPKDAQRHWDGLQAMQAAGAQAREYDKMPAEQVLADVNKSEPKSGGPEAVFAIEGYEIRRRAAEQSLKARQADPAAFAVRNGSWDALNLQDPQAMLDQLKTRANTQGQVSEQTGVNTPLLSKDEQRTVTQWLGNQAPVDRLRTLTQLRQSMPSDVAYGSLLHQIAPGSPLTALAGATLDKPAQAPLWYDPKFATSPIVGQRILEGESILTPQKDGKGGMKIPSFPMPKGQDLPAFDSAFQAAAGGAESDLFRGRPQTQEAYYAAYKAVYAAEASAAGHTNGLIDMSLAQRAAQMVLGHTTSYGHTNLAVPAGMDPTRFEGAVDAASHTALKASGYSDSDIKALRGYGLRELGDTLGTGRYVIINGNGDPLKSKDGGKSVVIDLNQQFARGSDATQ